MYAAPKYGGIDQVTEDRKQKTEDRGQRTEALSRLRRVLYLTCRVAAHKNSVLCPLSSVL